MARPKRSSTGEPAPGAPDEGKGEAPRRIGPRELELVVESSPSGFVMVDERGTILFVNRETERMFGYEPDELVGRSVEALVPTRFRGAHAGERATFFRAPETRAMGSGRDLYGVRKDGSELPVEIGLNPLDTPDGMRVLGTIVDITGRKRAEEALAARTAELARSNAALEQFAYVASHDLREPLRTVSSFTELLAKRYGDQLDERAQRYIRHAQQGTERMARLIDDLLTYSRVHTAGAEPTPVDADRCLTDALANLERSIRETGAEIEHDALPRVLADATQLTEVFQNLVANAIKFRGPEPPHIRVTAEPRGEQVCFRVRDNGIGIVPEHAHRIFEIFQRLHTRDEYPGTGLGLALCKRVVERHGGAIGVEPAEGRGSTFWLTLPAAPGP